MWLCCLVDIVTSGGLRQRKGAGMGWATYSTVPNPQPSHHHATIRPTDLDVHTYSIVLYCGKEAVYAVYAEQRRARVLLVRWYGGMPCSVFLDFIGDTISNTARGIDDEESHLT